MELSYKELMAKYTLLLEENRQLKEENDALCKRLGIGLPKTENSNINYVARINNHSTPQDKIRLFRSLFKGREDVFARRWYSVSTGKSGYQPVCKNEWNEQLCDKKKYKCADCPNRTFSPLSDSDIYRHLSGKDLYGRDIVGIYPMLANDTCLFLCADFDKESFKNDASAYKSMCDELNIPVSVEISRSGNGAHAWIFFSEPVSASDARKLGSGILTKAMEKYNLSFESYDRFFPNQDTVPKGGFGNLIALPLQGNARKNGNSVFVDESFTPYPDQWEYLCRVKKMSADDVEAVISTFCKNDGLGELISESEEKPWEIKRQKSVPAKDFPKSIVIVRSNMLYVPTNNLSAKIQNKIKRLAAFKNPDFYRAQAMRFPVYNKPRIIYSAEIFDSYIALPRGCEESLLALFESNGTDVNIMDKTNLGVKIPVQFNGTLRDEQQIAANSLLEHNIGVLSAATAFGKTVIASYLIGERKANALVLVHTQSLMTQWQKALKQFLNIDIAPSERINNRGRKKQWSPVGILGAGQNTLNGVVDVAVMQSLISEDEVKELVRNYGMIIVDECHHVSAVSFEKILKFANAKYVYGLTATPSRQDGHHPIIFMQCGPIRYNVDAKSQAKKREFEHYLIPRFTSARCADGYKNISDLYKNLSVNELRNSYIVSDIENALRKGRVPIVLTERREHVLLLREKLLPCCENIFTLFGTASQKERREALEKLYAVPDSEPLIIIATGKYIGEGFDYPRLDTLFLALPIAWKGKVAQYAGRLHRNYPNKKEVQIYDYVDVHIPVLERMYQKRLKGYSSIGYKVKSDTEHSENTDLIYDGKSYYPIYCEDLKYAQKEILIVSPFMRKNKALQLSKVLEQVVFNGAKVKIVTRPPDIFKESDRKNSEESTAILKNCGADVVYKSDFHQKFTVIDNKISWYGSVNFISFNKQDEGVMRFVSYDIAKELANTLDEV